MVTRAQLLGVGTTSRQIHHRLRTGALHRVHPGVYRVGHQAPSIEATYLAAVLACGKGGALSGQPAAWLWGTIRGQAPRAEVSSPRKRWVAGVRTRTRRLDSRDVTVHRGIPITTVPATLADLAASLPSPDLARACHEAGVKYGTTPGQVKQVLKRRPNTKGAAVLRRIMAGDEKVVLSRLESRFLALLRAHSLPLPLTNRVAGSHRVDCRWPEHRLTVELQSYRFHDSRHSWEQLFQRKREAFARGDDFDQFSWGDVFEEPRAMLDRLAELLDYRNLGASPLRG